MRHSRTASAAPRAPLAASPSARRRARALVGARALAFVALLLPWTGCPDGCGGGPDDDDVTGDDDATGALGLTAEAEVSEDVPTVVTVRWSTAEAAEGYVEFTPSLGGKLAAWSDAGEAIAHEVTLLGLRPSSTHALSVAAVRDGEVVDRVDLEVTTGDVPAQLSDLDVQRPRPDDAVPGYMTTALLARSAIVVLDTDGNYLWWTTEERPEKAIGRVALARDGCAVLYGMFPPMGSGPYGEFHEVLRVALDGSSVEVVEIDGRHHDFVELPDGTLATPVADVRTFDGFDVIGDRLVEVTPDGTERTVWSVWDDLDYTADQPPSPAEWSHMNAVDYLADEDAYLVSLRNLYALVEIDRASGESLWHLGGPRNDFTMVGDGTFTAQQHQFDVVDGGLVVFDNGLVEDLVSRAVEYRLDLDTMEVEQVWSYVSDPVLYNFAMGEVHRLDGGQTVVAWSISGQIDQVTPEGDLAWRLRTDLGGGFVFVAWYDQLPVCGGTIGEPLE